jgi:hypothetical protein
MAGRRSSHLIPKEKGLRITFFGSCHMVRKHVMCHKVRSTKECLNPIYVLVMIPFCAC